MLKLNYDRIAKFLENKYIFINIRNNLISYYFCKQTPVIFSIFSTETDGNCVYDLQKYLIHNGSCLQVMFDLWFFLKR